MPFWHRLVVLGAVLLVTVVAARLVDRRMARRDLPATAVTRYRVLRRAIVALIFFVGILSALLVIPQVRAVATGILASSAIVGIVVGFAAQRTIGNFIAGLLIAFTQPIRLGDYVEIDGRWGAVEEIGLTYTFVRVSDNDRLVIPNDRIVSDTIRNSSIRGRKKLAQVTVQVPLDRDLDTVRGLLREAADDERAENVLRRTRRRRQLAKGRRKRRLKLVLVAMLIILIALVASGVGAVAKFRASCDLNKLRPVENGQNSFVFAADGSLLGSIPAEKN